MANTKNTEVAENMVSVLDEAIREVAENVALPILQGKFFDIEGHDTVSPMLRKLQELVGGMVAEHDKLADATGNKRLVGKRGRKSGDAKSITTVDDAVARLTKR